MPQLWTGKCHGQQSKTELARSMVPSASPAHCGFRRETKWVHCRGATCIKGLCKAGGSNSRTSIKTLESRVLSDLLLKPYSEIISKKASCSDPHHSKVTTLKQCRHLHVWHSAGLLQFISISVTDTGVKMA